MTCRSCGATIADKAIVCYKCGTPTAIPEAPMRASRGQATPPSARVSPMAIFVVLVVVLAIAVGIRYKTEPGSLTQIVGIAIDVVAGVAALAWLRRR